MNEIVSVPSNVKPSDSLKVNQRRLSRVSREEDKELSSEMLDPAFSKSHENDQRGIQQGKYDSQSEKSSLPMKEKAPTFLTEPQSQEESTVELNTFFTENGEEDDSLTVNIPSFNVEQNGYRNIPVPITIATSRSSLLNVIPTSFTLGSPDKRASYKTEGTVVSENNTVLDSHANVEISTSQREMANKILLKVDSSKIRYSAPSGAAAIEKVKGRIVESDPKKKYGRNIDKNSNEPSQKKRVLANEETKRNIKSPGNVNAVNKTRAASTTKSARSDSKKRGEINRSLTGKGKKSKMSVKLSKTKDKEPSSISPMGIPVSSTTKNDGTEAVQENIVDEMQYEIESVAESVFIEDPSIQDVSSGSVKQIDVLEGDAVSNDPRVDQPPSPQENQTNNIVGLGSDEKCSDDNASNRTNLMAYSSSRPQIDEEMRKFILKTKDRMDKELRLTKVVKSSDKLIKQFESELSLLSSQTFLSSMMLPDPNELKVNVSNEMLPAVSSSTLKLLSLFEGEEESQCDPGKLHIGNLLENNNNNFYNEKFPELKAKPTTCWKKVDDMGVQGQRTTNQPGSIDTRRTYSEILGDDGSNKCVDQPKEQDFMKYFCSDWEHPIESYHLDERGSKSSRYSSQNNENKIFRFSEILEKIKDDDNYDIIFTYQLPKSAPFDLKDSLAEVRYECLTKWLTKTGNALFKSTFEAELKAKAEEKINEQLMEHIISLRKRMKRCEICNQPELSSTTSEVVTSQSTFSEDEQLSIHGPAGHNETTEECSVQLENVSEHSSDLEVEQELESLTMLLQKSQHSFFDDGDVLDRTSSTEREGSEDSRDTAKHLLSRATRRRREVRRRLEKIILLLESKMARMKKTHIVEYLDGEERAGEEITNIPENALSFKSCHCEDREEVIKTSVQLSIGCLDDVLKQGLLFRKDVTKKSRSVRSTHSVPTMSKEEITNEKLSQRQCLQLNLLGLRDSWNPSPQSPTGSCSDKIDERQLETLLDEDLKLQNEQESKNESVNFVSSGNETGTEKKLSTPKVTYEAKSAEGTIRFKLPYGCKCFCDRNSRLNPKKNQHFRTVLNEHFWCLRHCRDHETKDEVHANAPECESIFPPKVIEEPDNFKGWLADTDRNLLLLMSRSPLDRINKRYFKKIMKQDAEPLNVEKNEKVNTQETRLAELVEQLSRAQAERFWKQVDRWYEDYKKRDKVRAFLTILEQVDLNAMLGRDLALLKDHLKEELAQAKEQARRKIESDKKEEFEKEVTKLRESYQCQLKNRINAERRQMESKKEFAVRCMLTEAQDRFSPAIKKYKQKCVEWIETLRDRQNANSPSTTLRHAREIALIADKCDIGERARRRLLAATGKEHEEMEKILGKAVEARYVMIEGLKNEMKNLTRDVHIWRRAVREVLMSFKKFVFYTLKTRPERAQYFLSLEKLYQLQMDGLIRAQFGYSPENWSLQWQVFVQKPESYLQLLEANGELEKVETSEMKTAELSGERLQPTMEIKCPSHGIRYSSGLSETGSSADTDIEKDLRAKKVGDHVVEFAIRAVLPSPEHSIDGEGENEENSLEELEKLMDYNWNYETIQDEHSDESWKEDHSKLENRTTRVIGERASDPNITAEDFTKKRIREMLEIISSKKSLMKNYVHF